MFNASTARIKLLAFALLYSVCLVACEQGQIVSNEDTGETPASDSTYVERAKDLLDTTKEKAAQAPGQVAGWTMNDIKGIGDWEYKILRFDDLTDAELEEELNQLGTERWECFWVDTAGESPRYFFKKSRRSYLRNIPLGDLLKFVPLGGDAEP